MWGVSASPHGGAAHGHTGGWRGGKRAPGRHFRLSVLFSIVAQPVSDGAQPASQQGRRAARQGASSERPCQNYQSRIPYPPSQSPSSPRRQLPRCQSISNITANRWMLPIWSIPRGDYRNHLEAWKLSYRKLGGSGSWGEGSCHVQTVDWSRTHALGNRMDWAPEPAPRSQMRPDSLSCLVAGWQRTRVTL